MPCTAARPSGPSSGRSAILSVEIDFGIAEHHRLIMRKVKAPIVSGISDFVGGADLPDRSIWDYPQKLLLKALDLNKGGQRLQIAAVPGDRGDRDAQQCQPAGAVCRRIRRVEPAE